MMTPKEAYEARKAERQARQSEAGRIGRSHVETDSMIEDLLDRLVTAFERIADAMERPKP